mmetsp:Transcript_1595/g.6972  ORF Transcript_1595/g.6972 Transcript_1595/m.6972 type:complete len:295 (+) Transcript_1595:1508-2392(+)
MANCVPPRFAPPSPDLASCAPVLLTVALSASVSSVSERGGASTGCRKDREYRPLGDIDLPRTEAGTCSSRASSACGGKDWLRSPLGVRTALRPRAVPRSREDGGLLSSLSSRWRISSRALASFFLSLSAFSNFSFHWRMIAICRSSTCLEICAPSSCSRILLSDELRAACTWSCRISMDRRSDSSTSTSRSASSRSSSKVRREIILRTRPCSVTTAFSNFKCCSATRFWMICLCFLCSALTAERSRRYLLRATTPRVKAWRRRTDGSLRASRIISRSCIRRTKLCVARAMVFIA